MDSIQESGERGWPAVTRLAALAAVLVVVSVLTNVVGSGKTAAVNRRVEPANQVSDDGQLQAAVLPVQGVALPIRWGSVGSELVGAGVIDLEKFEAIYVERGGFPEELRTLLAASNAGTLVMTQENSSFLLNLFWAFGLANDNPLLALGRMTDGKGLTDEGIARARRFASTGGWTLAKGDAMEHYSRHTFVRLTPAQQALVERVAGNIYRPCCDNSTSFPDCNHGMAMLGLLELMAANGTGEAEMYRVALRVNAYWFPDTYVTIAEYLAQKGQRWQDADPRELLGRDYSSASGYQRVLNAVTPVEGRSGGSCGV